MRSSVPQLNRGRLGRASTPHLDRGRPPLTRSQAVPQLPPRGGHTPQALAGPGTVTRATVPLSNML